MSEWPLQSDEASEQEVIAAILKIFPDAEVLADNEAQVVIYTGLMWSGKHGENIAGRHNLQLEVTKIMESDEGPVIKIADLPTPDCESGYTKTQLDQILRNRRMELEFTAWMGGQTQSLCEGRKYNHETKEYEEACGGVAHGSVVYPWDLQRFLDGFPIID